MANKSCKCIICHNSFMYNKVTPISIIRESIFKLIKDSNPNVELTDFICNADLNIFRKKIFEKIIQDDKGDLDDIQSTILRALQERETISTNLNEPLGNLTFGEKVSDKVAEFGGSWKFILICGAILSTWVLWNTISNNRFDPYPYILLNLFLSMIAALQAPIIMMSQNRQSLRDRQRIEEDYKINLKSEIDIRMINEKIDKLISHQWQRTLEIQEMQFELMNEVRKNTHGHF